ncbi:hypothetical protein ACEPAH_2400 [Sanghuangporus vaninii]
MEFYLLFARLARNTFLLRRLDSPSSLAGDFTVRYPLIHLLRQSPYVCSSEAAPDGVHALLVTSSPFSHSF